MLPYYLLVIVTFLAVPFDFVKPKAKARIVIYWFICLVLIFFAGCRSLGVDNDSLNYDMAFTDASKLSWWDLFTGNTNITIERGYLIFNRIVGDLGGDIHVVFLLMAFFTGLINYNLIYRKSPYPFTSLLIYVGFFYFYRDFTQIRFAFSAAVAMQALFLFHEEKRLISYILILFAASIHSSILVMFLLFLLYALVRKKWIYLLLPVLGLIGGLYDPIVFLFNLGGLPPTLANYVEQNEFGRGGYVASAIAQLFLIGILIYYKNLKKYYDAKLLDLMFVALSLSSFINLLFISFSIMQRLSLMLFGVILFLGTYFFKILEKNRYDQDFVLIIHLFFNVYMLYYGLKMIDPFLLRPYSMF